MENQVDVTAKRSGLQIRGAIEMGLVLLLIDFTAKIVANALLPLDRLVETPVPFFSWRLTYNTGSHYLLGSVGDFIPYRLMMGVAEVAVLALIYLLAREVRELAPSRLRTVQLLMIAGLIGSLGNALEVVAIGRATDFFMIHPFPWPANLCDQFVNATVFVLLPLSLIFMSRRKED
jgi:lipoprotein signal peptidase